MAIKITRYSNNVVSEVLESIGSGDDFNVTPDDRIELVQTINGVTAVDGGRFPVGDKYGMSAVFDSTTLTKLKTVWSTRERVSVTLDDNSTITNALVIIKNLTYYDKYLPMYVKVTFEVWAG